MKNKALVLAGLGLGSALTLSAFSLASANEATSTATNTTAITSATSTTRPANKMIMNFGGGKAERGMMHGGKEGGMFMMKFGGPEGENSAIRDAITNNDYNAFVTAWNADTNKPSDATVPTQEQFTQMATMAAKHATIEAALTNNDYDGYVKATTPTREEFTKMSEQHIAQNAIHAAIEAKDYDAFKSAAKNTPMADITEEDFNNFI